MVRSPAPILLSVGVYLYLVKMGPIWMKSRKAYDLKNTMIIYNICMVLLSLYMFYEVQIHGDVLEDLYMIRSLKLVDWL